MRVSLDRLTKSFVILAFSIGSLSREYRRAREKKYPLANIGVH